MFMKDKIYVIYLAIIELAASEDKSTTFIRMKGDPTKANIPYFLE